MCKYHREHSLRGFIEVATGGKRGEPRGCRLLCMLVGLLAGFAPVTSKAQPPPAVEITPNAIQKLDEPMGIQITGSRSSTLHVLVLRSCDSNPATPELSARGNCQTPLWRTSVTLDQKGQWHHSLRLTELTEQPLDEQLWLRVSVDPAGHGPCGQTIFTIRSGRSCSLGETFLSLFTGGACTVGSPRIIVMEMIEQPWRCGNSARRGRAWRPYRSAGAQYARSSARSLPAPMVSALGHAS